MRNFKAILFAGAAAFCSIQASAQDLACTEAQELGYKPYPYNFIQVQGGVGSTFTDVSCWKLLTPTYSIGVGRMFSPIVGTRLHVNGWKSKGGFDDVLDCPGKILKYKYNYINTNADILVNVLNIFSSKVNNPLSLYVVGGLGLNYAWDNDEFEAITANHQIVGNNLSQAWGDNQSPRNSLLSHNLRLGLLADYNVAKNLSIGAEVDFNSLDDRFNSKSKDADDWMMTAQISLTYKFGFKAVPKPAPTPAPVVASKPKPEVVTPAPKPVEVQKPVVVEPVKETIFYAIRESDINNETIINKVAEWCKKNPNKSITVDGYADKETGNSKLNAEYAKKRAEKVAAALKAKGVPASQMIVKSYGDTVQPFSENDKNRCVIIEGK